MATWTRIHDFFYGWGLHTSGEVIVHEERVDGGFPVRVISAPGQRTLFAEDVKHFWDIDLFKVPENELDDLYLRTTEALAEEAKKRKLKPVCFDKIAMPNISKDVNSPDIREVLSASCIKDMLSEDEE